MQLTPARRAFAGLAVAAVALATAPAPASAAAAVISMYVGDVTAPIGAGSAVGTSLFADADVTLSQPRAVHELIGDLAGVTLTSDDSYCENETPARLVCASPFRMDIDQEYGGSGFEVRVQAAPTATAGATGTLRTTFTATGVAAVRHDSRVRVAERVNLTAGPTLKLTGAPGAALNAPLVVSNSGDKAITGAAVTFDHDYEINPTGTRYRNCLYAGDRLRSCTFDQTLEKGVTYSAAFALQLGADTRAPGNAYGYRNWLTAAEWEDQLAAWQRGGYDPGTPGTGDLLTLTPRTAARLAQGDPDTDDNWTSVEIRVTGTNGVDLAAAGAEAAGVAGAEVPMTVGVRSVGPATLNRSRVGEPAAFTTVTVPAGATVTAAPAACYPFAGGQVDWDASGRPGAAKYQCVTGYVLKAGAEEMYAFTVRLGSVSGTTTGQVWVNQPCECSVFEGDVDTSNNRAPISVAVAPPVPGQQPATKPAVKPASVSAAGWTVSKATKAVASAAARRR